MREIKFRALSKLPDLVIKMYPNAKPMMRYGSGIFKDGYNTWISYHNEKYSLRAGVLNNINIDAEKGGNYVIDENTIGQYTGLKDKNGIEIYEGDIVNAIYFKNKRIGKIVFNDNMACFELYVKHEDGHINSYLIGDMNSIEVIGNIYENPELLQN